MNSEKPHKATLSASGQISEGPATADATQSEVDALVKTLRAELDRAGHFVSIAGLITPEVAAEIIGVKVGTLDKWRGLRMGPRFVKVARIRYQLRDVAEYLVRKKSW